MSRIGPTADPLRGLRGIPRGLAGDRPYRGSSVVVVGSWWCFKAALGVVGSRFFFI